MSTATNRPPLADADLIRLQGANARAAGVDYFSNPFTSLDRVPAATGEDIGDWAAKVRAWWDGWEVEDFLRHD